MFGLEDYQLLVLSLIGTFILLLFTGFPIAWLLSGVSLLFTGLALYLYNQHDVDTFFLYEWGDSFPLVIDRTWQIMSNWVLVALPMFIFMGLMLERSGVAEQLMRNFVKVFGRFKGGLALAVVLIGILFAASTGIVGASVVLLATLSIPIMLEQRYSPALAAGVVASSGTLGILIPPSIMLVLMADQVGVAVGDLFMGAIFPGVMLGVLYLTFVIVAAQIFPKIAPKPKELPPLDAKVIRETLLAVIPPILLILAVLGSIFAGIATPTEASGVGAAREMLLALANKRLNWRTIVEVGRETTLTTAFIFGIFLGATAFSLVMRKLGGDEYIAEIFTGLGFTPAMTVLFILFVTFLAGFFLDWLEITLIILPLVAPVVEALGFDLRWFIVLFAVTLQTSFITPPVGFSLFYLKGVVPPEVTTKLIYKGIIPFVMIQLMAIGLVFKYNDLVLWLPNTVEERRLERIEAEREAERQRRLEERQQQELQQ
ncbi:MAG: TRAP transporter large permease subunit [Alphaproteobacteria bacterium]